MSTDVLMTVAELARMLRVSEAWVYRKSRSGEIPTVHLGRNRRFSHARVTEWIGRREDSRGF